MTRCFSCVGRVGVLLAVLISACEGGPAAMDPTDGGDGGAAPDGGTTGGAVCSDDSECDDGLFCNGAERCEPGNPDARADGCVDAREDRCLDGQSCDEDGDRCQSDCEVEPDADGDGHAALECGGDDCDDADRLRFPGNVEVCDALDRDEDCDPSTFGVRDADSDGEPDAMCCNGETCGTDCDDSRSGVSPTVPEVCNGIDDDCDGEVDEGVEVELYRDADEDGYGDATMATTGCPDSVDGYVADDSDCDDTRGDVHPGAVDACDVAEVDEDCSGVPNDPPGGCSCTGTETSACALPGICSDGVRMCLSGEWGDCSISPEAFEVCDLEDDDCNGVVDDGLRRNCWPDGDADGYAVAGATSSSECATPTGGCPSGYTARAPVGDENIDCADMNGSRSPGETEVCNTVDDDCDGTVDESLTVICYRDEDNDGYAAGTASATERCPDDGRVSFGYCPIGWTNRAPTSGPTTDCNDDPTMGGGTVHPSAVESCDGIDNDCDGAIDDGARVTCWADGDDDGFATASAESMELCRDASRPSRGNCPFMWTGRDPSGGTSDRDCNEGDAATFPGAPELCGAGDNDCDGTTSDETTVSCYSDSDNDGYPADSATAMDVCPDGSRGDFGYCPTGMTDQAPTTGNVDCAPTDPTRNPGVTEMCDEPTFVDSNCNGDVDEGTVTCWRDDDDDGYASYGASTSRQCRVTARDGAPHYGCAVGWTGREPASDGSADCNDSSAGYHTIVRCYPDSDNDSYRRSGSSTSMYCYDSSAGGYGGCPTGRTTRTNVDCCDASANVRPNQTSYFSTPRPSSCGGGYDYDCNGSQQRRWTTVKSGSCTATSSGACSTASSALVDGWGSTVPGCGSSSHYWTGCAWGITR